MGKNSTILNKKFGRLTVVERIAIRGQNSPDTIYKCICDCGRMSKVQYSNLKNGNSRSCGCRQKELVSIRSRKPKGEASKRCIWSYYRRNARTRNINWDLTYDDFVNLILLPCHYCGEAGVTKTRMRHGDSLEHNGVDRFYNHLGYTKDNVVSCCKFCNIAKSYRHPKDFEQWVIDVYTTLFEGGYDI